MKQLFLIVVVTYIFFPASAQELNQQEKQLYKIITEYRKSANLPEVPVSKSLTTVAQTHVKDLQNNKPVTNTCNMHSWSSNGKWQPVCYTGDRKSAELMWSKPRELTSYKGDGYEIAYYTSADFNPENALKSWKESKGHNDVIMNKGIWTRSWNAMGIGVYGNYAVVWFGVEKD